MARIVVGISGGVDSSVAAYLLKQQGHEVIGLFMINWEEDSEACTSEQDYEDVKRVCSAIGIPYYSVNYSKEYYDRVFKYFLDEYKNGRTPNPDVLCNREIKFGPFLEFAKKIGADYIATGHYCKKLEIDGECYLAKARDLNKDQSYFLNQISKDQLNSVIFPLQDIDKPTVRKIANELGLVNANKKDSTGICFIGERNFKKFLSEYLPNQPGEIRTIDGIVVGRHDGLMYYTIGQRRGLGIGGRPDSTGERWFVVEKDLKNNVLFVSQGEGKELFSNGLISGKFNWITRKPDLDEFDCFAKFRYRQPDQKVRIKIDGDHIIVKFYEPQRAITEGQYVVLYKDLENDNSICLGGGVIEKAIFDKDLTF